MWQIIYIKLADQVELADHLIKNGADQSQDRKGDSKVVQWSRVILPRTIQRTNTYREYIVGELLLVLYNCIIIIITSLKISLVTLWHADYQLIHFSLSNSQFNPLFTVNSNKEVTFRSQCRHSVQTIFLASFSIGRLFSSKSIFCLMDVFCCMSSKFEK